ncbi:MAG: haloacid dehalogenase [Acidobacteria bacterium]|nr:MAG: haloacid dehalogenase [Acidobacteriota bacterium]
MAPEAGTAPRIEWERIRVVGIDLMDTLIVDPFREALAEATGERIEDLEGLVDRGAWPAFELGEIDEEGYAARYFLPGSGRTLDAARLRRALFRRYRFVPGMRDLARAIARVRPVHVLSNYSPWYEAIRERFELDLFASGHHPSYEVGARKPDPEYFLRVARRIGVRPSAILFVDDRERNVRGAASLGIPSLRFDSATQLRRDLRPLLRGARG